MLRIGIKSGLRVQRCSLRAARFADQLCARVNVCALVYQRVNLKPRGYPAEFGVTPSQIPGVTPAILRQNLGLPRGSNQLSPFDLSVSSKTLSYFTWACPL